ncbi:MAG: pectate lyase, partial [Polyangiales bacterium]
MRNRLLLLSCLGLLLACGDDDAGDTDVGDTDAAPADAAQADVPALDAIRADVPAFDAGPVDCAAVETAGYELCESTADSCSFVFDDSAGCPSACANVGLVCGASYEDVDSMCAGDLTMSLDCANTGHISDYCVCERAPMSDAGVDAGVDAGTDAARPDAGPPGEVLAFPSAQGAGAYATGGRGGRVIRVTNLNDSGEGSLRAALSADGPRIITFAVSGTILLDSTLNVRNGDFTLAGQTAPEGGITLAGRDRVIAFSGADNFIVRYIRVRPRYSTFDALGLIGCSNFIFDHTSASWGGDEIMTTRGDTDDVTFQRLLLAEGKTGTLFGDSNDPSLSDRLSFHHNAYYNVTHRHPNVHTYGRADVYNNVVFNWKFRWSVVIGDMQLNHIGNYYSQGCLTNPTGGNSFMKAFYNAAFTPELHSAGNLVMPTHLTDPDEDNWRLWNWRVDVNEGPYAGAAANSQLTTDYQAAEPFPLLGPPAIATPAQAAFDDVSNDVGANRRIDAMGNVVTEQDALDALYLRNIRAGECVSYMSNSSSQNYNTTTHYNTFIDSLTSTPVATGPADANEDGIPDAWIMS